MLTLRIIYSLKTNKIITKYIYYENILEKKIYDDGSNLDLMVTGEKEHECFKEILNMITEYYKEKETVLLDKLCSKRKKFECFKEKFFPQNKESE